jgi:FkbM family methyltransferase
MKKLVKLGFEKLGYKIQRIPTIESQFTMEGALKRCINRGLQIETVIDVGASDGRWSRICMNFLPNAKYLLIEAQQAHQAGLEKLKAENEKVDYILAAAGKKKGTIYFDNSGLFGGLASETPFETNCIEVPVISIDEEVKRYKLKPTYLIKLDTHGFEVPILEGAMETIKQAELIIIETYNYRLTNDSLKYYQMCDFMEKLGFSSVEVVDFMLRKHDHSFWQMDIFFIQSNRKEFSYTAF